MASLYTPVHNRQHPYAYSKFYQENNAPTFNSLIFPIKLRDITKFENENSHLDITVSVFGVHEWKDRKNKKKHFIPECSLNFESISTMSDDNSESEGEEEMTTEDKEFLDDQTDHMSDLSMYHRLETENIRSEIEKGPELEPATHKTNEKPMRGYIYPIRIASRIGARHVNLLLTENNGSSHYSSIKNLDGLLRAQYTKSGSNKRFHCYECLHGFIAKKGEKTRDQCKNLQEHISYCKSVDPQLVSYPKNEVAKFTNLRKMLKAPVVCYADFMSILEKTGDIDTTTGIQDKPDNSKHTKYQAHKPVSYFKKVDSVDPLFQLDQEIDF